MGCWVDGSISGMARELKRRCKGAERAGARWSEERGGARVIGKGRRKVIGKGMWHGNDAGRMLEGHRA